MFHLFIKKDFESKGEKKEKEKEKERKKKLKEGRKREENGLNKR